VGNQNSGRRPSPTSLTVLRGNPSKKRLNENEPTPPHGSVEKPTGLTPGGELIWDELAPVCLAMRTLTTADVRAFFSLCELQATMVEAAAAKSGRQLFSLEKEKEGSDTVHVVVDAVLRLERETANALRPYYEYFGLTPSSRARLSVPKRKDEPVSKWAGALK
jgi:phage terminase small subunit